MQDDSFAPVAESDLLSSPSRLHEAIINCLGPILVPRHEAAPAA